MRVSQLQNLAWAGNVLVLAGLVWVGWQFWQVRRQPPPKPWTWEKATGTKDPRQERWPGKLESFVQIWTTPVGGKVPPPPPPPPPPEKPDPLRDFKAGLKYLGGWELVAEPYRSAARISFQGKEQPIRPGESVGGFTLRSYSVVTRDGQKLGRLVFVHPLTGEDVPIEQAPADSKPLAEPGQVAFAPVYGGAIVPKQTSPTDKLARTAFQLDNGEWVIPDEEQTWIESFGEKYMKLEFQQDTDAAGVSHGLKVLKPIEEGTPLAKGHGIVPGDIVRSINGVPITSKEDVLLYLRGKGKGLDRYDVVIDSLGKSRTVVYRVPRRRD